MYSLYLECAEQESELLSADLWEHGATGIQEDALPNARCLLRAWFDEPGRLLDQFAPFNPRIEPEPDVDWEAACRQAWRAFDVGRRLHLAPEWDEDPTPRGRLRLTIHPGQALGSGAHPATQLCLEALEATLLPADTVLDVGTGSGILLAAASLLGARRAIGCDIDQASVAIARANLIADAVPPLLFAGSTRALPALSVDVIVANINAVTHAHLAPEYARLARRVLIVSGFPTRQAEPTTGALAQHGFSLAGTLSREDWTCLILTPHPL